MTTDTRVPVLAIGDSPREAGAPATYPISQEEADRGSVIIGLMILVIVLAVGFWMGVAFGVYFIAPALG